MIKEIRELEDEVREVESSAVGSRDLVVVENEGKWGERVFVDEDSGEDADEDLEDKGFGDKDSDEGFSIGDTMLGCGEKRDNWKSETLEDKAWEEEEDFGGDDFEEEEESSFDYEEVGRGEDDFYRAGGSEDLYSVGGAGDLYGVGGGSSDVYGVGSSGASGAYNVGKGNREVGGVQTYVVGAVGAVSQGSDLYGAGGKKKKRGGATLYAVEGGKKSGKRRGEKSGLVGTLKSKRGRKGVSIY